MNQKTPINFFLLFLFLATLAWPPPLYAAQLININTADQAALETLNGIGPSKAQAIISYRTQNGPFAKIEDLMNVSGIGTATFNNIKASITVGDSSTAQTQTTSATSSSQTQMQAPSQGQSAGVGPPTLTVRITADARSMAGGGSYFSAAAYGSEDTPLPNARYLWNFGDGSVAEGTKVFHTFSYPGRYVVSATVAYNYSAGIDRVVVEAISAAVSFRAPGDGSLLIFNKSSGEINIGLWSLVDGGKSYIIPADTIILANEGVRFSPAVTGLSGSPSAVLLYPNGMPAAAAVVSADSPLRGERIVGETPRKSTPAKSTAGEVLGASTSTPTVVNSGVPSPLCLSLGALAVLLVGGAGAVHYLGLSAKRLETPVSADEFDIEE